MILNKNNNATKPTPGPTCGKKKTMTMTFHDHDREASHQGRLNPKRTPHSKTLWGKKESDDDEKEKKALKQRNVELRKRE